MEIMDQHILVTKWVGKIFRKKFFIWLKNSKKKKKSYQKVLFCKT